MGTYTKEQLTQQLNRIQAATTQCISALQQRNIDVPANAKLADLANYVDLVCGSKTDIRLEYIQAEETPSSPERTSIYFNTNLLIGRHTSIEISYQNTYNYTGTTDSFSLLGCAQTTDASYSFTDDCFLAAPASDAGYKYAWGYKNNSDATYSTDNSTRDTSTHVLYVWPNRAAQGGSFSYTYDSFNVYYDDNTSVGIAKRGYFSSRRTYELPLFIFGQNNNGSLDNSALKGTRIHYIKIYDSCNLVRFYIPVLHWVNNKYTPCFYDKVNDTYIYNLGSGELLYQTSDDELLDSIIYPETGATSAGFDTSIYIVTQGINIDSKFSASPSIYNDSINQQCIVGYQYDDTYRYGLYCPMNREESTDVAPYIGYAIPKPNTTYDYNAIEAQWDEDYAVSAFLSTLYSGVQEDGIVIRGIYSNGNRAFKVDPLESSNPTVGKHIFIFGNPDSSGGIVMAGTKVYYSCVTCTGQNGLYLGTYRASLIPVLHNDVPCFYDLNRKIYITNSGTTTCDYTMLGPNGTHRHN